MTALQVLPVRKRRRSALLWGALTLTLALTLWTALQPDRTEPTDELSAPRSQPARTTAVVTGASGALPSSASAPVPRTAWAALGSVGRSAWAAPPVPTPEPAAKALAPARPVAEASLPPQAPPPPFTLIGRYQDSRGPVALLATPQRTLAVREGELADPQWRVDNVAAQRIQLTWLPGALKRSLAYPPGT